MPKENIASSKEQLSRCTREFVHGLLTGDANHPAVIQYASPDFTAASDLTGTMMDLAEYLGLVRQVMARDPSYEMQILGDSVDFNHGMDKLYAIVWQFVTVTDSPEGVEREGLTVSRWRLEEGRWLCHHFTRFRGNPLVSGLRSPESA